jgi:hypothetical protein
MQSRHDTTCIRVKSMVGMRVSNLPYGVSCDINKIWFTFRSDLARHYYQTGCEQGFTRNASDWIFFEHCIQHSIGHLICNLVWMSLGYGF